jgi:hypothetical protein
MYLSAKVTMDAKDVDGTVLVRLHLKEDCRFDLKIRTNVEEYIPLMKDLIVNVLTKKQI